MLSKLIAWAALNPEAAFSLAALVVMLLRAVYAFISRVVAPYPRLRAAVEAAAALGPDVARFGLQFARAVTGKPLPSVLLDTRDAELARLRETVARQAALLAQLAPDNAAGRSTQAPPPPIPPVALGVLLALFAGCPKVTREPSPEPPREGCTQRATLCHQGHPWVCGPGGRWSQADRRCDRMGVACCLASSPYGTGPRHACVPATACIESADGGVR